MKKIFLILFCTAIAFLSSYQAKADCPPGWDGSYTVDTVVNGCNVEYTYCYKIDENGFHCISLNDIKFGAGCDSAFIEKAMKEFTEEILLQIGLGEAVVKRWDIVGEIGPCPDNTMCLLKLDDAICYDGLKLNEKKQWIMNKCDNEIRGCNEILYYCWDYDVKPRKLVIRHVGMTVTGPPCKYPCHTNCGK